MKTLAFWTTSYREEKTQQLQMLQVFSNRRERRTWHYRSNVLFYPCLIMWGYILIFLQQKSWEKALSAGPYVYPQCCTYITKFCSQVPHCKSGDTLLKTMDVIPDLQQHLWNRFWPLTAFFRLFSVHSSICGISIEKKSHNVAMIEA